MHIMKCEKKTKKYKMHFHYSFSLDKSDFCKNLTKYNLFPFNDVSCTRHKSRKISSAKFTKMTFVFLCLLSRMVDRVLSL